MVSKTSGYSGTPLVRKLGIKPGMRVAWVRAPSHISELIGPLPAGTTELARPGRGMDLVHLFVTTQIDLGRRFGPLAERLAPAGMLWVSWPKKTSELFDGLGREEVRRIGLDLGLVDVKVCAVDADWSGLKFVRRLKDR